ncbi:hypothetical protein GCM10028778_11540 [Barrientosiimonas marina]|uniref:histidine kinase n=1 Tax=Lentibacillus kimchii TaxID=1542911 RepID=A0ABW2UYG8_9BACI
MTNRYYWQSPGHHSRDYHHSALSPSPIFNNLASLPAPILQWIDQNMGGFITVLDQYGIIRYISKTVEPILGLAAEDLIGTTWHQWVSEENATYLEANVDKTLQEQKTFNLELQTCEGKRMSTANLLTSVKDDNQKLFYIVATKDRTDKKEAEDMMVHSEKMSVAGQLSAGIAHEIRNPLTSLKGFLQLLQAGVKNEEAFYPIMIDEIEKMETITSELLFISKPMTDQQELQNLSEMIDDVATLLKPQAGLKNIIILQEQNPGGMIECDRSQIKQVFINLFKNAIEAMDNPGYITVKDQSDQDNIIIDVIDEGSGIHEDVIHKLGDPFFTTKQNGTGLGLMITQQILKNHNGRLDIFRNNTIGSTFRVIFQKLNNN